MRLIVGDVAESQMLVCLYAIWQTLEEMMQLHQSKEGIKRYEWHKMENAILSTYQKKEEQKKNKRK